jgi:hypothetical protein
MRKEWVVGVVVLLTCVFMGPALMEPPDRGILLYGWTFSLDE